ncbi:MAG: hypothetical protein KDD82_18075 [Planctomycetes bacterium]|nr:hypothetical protein [Planctomycetota bacterium]
MLRCLLLLAVCALPVVAQEIDEDQLEELIEQALLSSKKKQLDLTDYGDPEHKERALEVRAQLQSRRVSLEFDKEDPLDALDHLRELSGVNLVISAKVRKLFEEEDLKATLKVQKIRLVNALELFLKGLHEDLAYGYRNGVLMVVLREEWKSVHYLQVYPVGDLLHKPKDFPAPKLTLGENGVETR